MEKFKVKLTSITFFASLMALFFISSCTNAQQSSTSEGGAIVNASAEEFKKGMHGENVILIDVRTPDEVSQGMIEGAQDIDIYSPNFAKRIAELDTNKTVYVYCRSGGRSSRAAQQMKEIGFKKIYNLWF